MLFVKHPWLLKKLVSELLGIKLESIEQFVITNPEMPPEILSGKFCRLDINMTVDNRLTVLEIQVEDEGDYPERALYYWAREYSTALAAKEKYRELPRVIIISIVNFELFDCKGYHSEYQALEVTHHIPLTDKMCLQFYELPKLQVEIREGKALELWLALFKADTEEEITKIEKTGVPELKEAIEAYYSITADSEFREIERMREKASHDEAQALYNAEKREREKWQGVAAENKQLRLQLAELQAQLDEVKK